MAYPGLSQSALDIIKAGMRLSSLIGPEENPTNVEAANGLMCLNQMLDSWQLDRLSIFTVDITDFPFVGGQQTYTLGAGGNFNIPRPARIEAASAILGPNSGSPIELPMTYTQSESEWQGILIKSVTVTYPFVVYDDGGMPFRGLHMWPIPADSSQAFRLYSWEPLAQFDTLGTTKLFPPGYAEAIRYNLALRLADDFDEDVRPSVVQRAMQSLDRLRISNVEIGLLTADDVVMDKLNDGSTGLSSTIPPNY